jgi:hypothetical protein
MKYSALLFFLTCIFSTFGCNPSRNTVSGTAPEAEGEYSTKIQVPFSKGEWTSNIQNHKFKFTLGTAQGPDQRPVWDEAKAEGLLQFGGIIRYNQEIYAKYPKAPGGREMYTCRENNYLFTKVSQHNISEKYDNGNAKIYLKNKGQDIEIGEYRTPEAGNERHTWLHPSLCEGNHAKTCRAVFQARQVHTDNGWPEFLLTAEIYLTENGKEELAFEAKSPTERVYENFKHFGCEVSK